MVAREVRGKIIKKNRLLVVMNFVMVRMENVLWDE